MPALTVKRGAALCTANRYHVALARRTRSRQCAAPHQVALRDGKGAHLPTEGQQVQFCLEDSPFVLVGTVKGCRDLGIDIDYPLRHGSSCGGVSPYANVLLDGGPTFRPLPQEAVLERHQLTAYALPGNPEIRLMGDLFVELDLMFKPESMEHKAFFFDFAATMSQQHCSSVSQQGPGLYRFWRDVGDARRMVEQTLAPFRR